MVAPVAGPKFVCLKYVRMFVRKKYEGYKVRVSKVRAQVYVGY